VPRVQPIPDLLGGVRPPPPFGPRQHHPTGGDPDQPGDAKNLQHLHRPSLPYRSAEQGPGTRPKVWRVQISLDEALEIIRTGDLWIFRGSSAADRAIRLSTNSPVNHVGVTVALEDLPALMWHAELGRSLPDLWSGDRHRGVQLHDARDAVTLWANRYGQHAWLRQLDQPVTRAMEDAVLRTIARLDGTPFPSTARLASRWLAGRVPIRARKDTATLETAYCAEVVATTYQAMGLLPEHRRPNSYDPGSFWSGDDLALSGGARLGKEIAVTVPAVG
jgi:hypothetical protein